jgi:hypothetical protein
MTTLREVAQQALEALTASNDLLGTMYLKMDAITALRAALAQEEPWTPAKLGDALVQWVDASALAQQDDPHPPSRHCMCDACKPAFEPTPGAEQEQPNRAQQMRDAGYARRPTLREMVEQEREDIAQNLQSRLDAALLLEERRQEIAQPHREWKGLSDTEVLSIHQSLCNTVGSDYRTVARAIEQALRSKNHE